MADDVQFYGETIRLAEDGISEWSLMEFAEAAGAAESESLGALAAIMRLLREAVHPEDWDLFSRTARANRAGAEDCLPVVVAVTERVAARPTGQPSDSSAGLPATAPKSTVVSSSPVTDLLAGRPDLQLVAKRAAEAKAS